jgi:RNA polymerase sigma factor (sigma-70 family)
VESGVTEVDRRWQEVKTGDPRAFAGWLRLTEIPLRRSLRRFATAVDVEEVMQEGLLRLWMLAPGKDLRGENASLRYAVTVMHNLARKIAKRNGLIHLIPDDEIERTNPVNPGPLPDPALARIIKMCLGKLPRKPRRVMEMIVAAGHAVSNRILAERLGMKLNTLVQNLVRGRKALRRCLERNGVRLDFLET